MMEAVPEGMSYWRNGARNLSVGTRRSRIKWSLKGAHNKDSLIKRTVREIRKVRYSSLWRWQPYWAFEWRTGLVGPFYTAHVTYNCWPSSCLENVVHEVKVTHYSYTDCNQFPGSLQTSMVKLRTENHCPFLLIISPFNTCRFSYLQLFPWGYL